MPLSKKGKILARVTLFLTLSSMRQNKKLNFLVIGVLAFSFLNIVFFSSVNNGFAEAINNQLIDYSTGHLVIDPAEEHRYIEDWTLVRNKLLAFSEVQAVSPELSMYSEVRKKDKFRTVPITGVDANDAVLVKRIQDRLVAGDFLEENDVDKIVIGSAIAGGKYDKDSILSGNRIDADVGDTITLTFTNGVVKDFKVKGIFRTNFLGVDLESFIPLKTMEEVIGVHDKASQVIVRLFDKEDSSVLKSEFINSGLKEKVTSWEENAGFSRSITSSLGMVSQITRVIGLLTAFVTVFIVIFIKTRNQRSQIATLRAVGISDNAIMGSYLIEAVLLGAIGVIIGVTIMRFLIVYFTGAPMELPIGSVVPIMTAQNQWSAVFLLLASTLFAGYYPTKSVVKENIIEAIRGVV